MPVICSSELGILISWFQTHGAGPPSLIDPNLSVVTVGFAAPKKNTPVFSGSADKYLIAHKIDTYGVISEKIVTKHSDHGRWSREVPYMEFKRPKFVTVHFKVS